MATASVLGNMLFVGNQNMVRRRRREVAGLLLSESPIVQYSAWEEEIFGKIENRCRANPDLMRVLVFLETGEGVERHMRILRRSLLDDEVFDAYLSQLARILDGEDIETDVPNWLLRRFSLETMNRLWNKLKRFLTTCKDAILACACKVIECCSGIYSTIKNYFLGITLGPDALNALFYGAAGGAFVGAIAGGIAGGMMGGPPGACLGLIGGGLGGGCVGGLSTVAVQKIYTVVKERFFDRPRQEAVDISFDLIGVEPSSSFEDLQEHFIGALERSDSEADMMTNLFARGFIEASQYS